MHLPVIELPRGMAATPAGEEIYLEDAHGNAERVAMNDRGGWSRHVGPHAFGNYATMADAVRAAAREGYNATALD